jgi:hypothetical protein
MRKIKNVFFELKRKQRNKIRMLEKRYLQMTKKMKLIIKMLQICLKMKE